jgi:hypothetical protein
MTESTPKALEGTWTLIGPDGRQWTGDSPLRVARAEQAERVPDSVAVKRIFTELTNPTIDQILHNQVDISNPRDEVEVIIDTGRTQRKITVNIGPVMAFRAGNIDNLVVRRSDGALLARIKNGETLFGKGLPGNL